MDAALACSAFGATIFLLVAILAIAAGVFLAVLCREASRRFEEMRRGGGGGGPGGMS